MGNAYTRDKANECLLSRYDARNLVLWRVERRWVLVGVVLAWTLNTHGWRVAKRLLDLVVGSTVLVLALPIMAAAAIAIRLDSPGPVLFRQARLGRWGKPFTCLKFRSMHVDAEERRAGLEAQSEENGPVFKMAHDPRVTRVGRVLRRFSIDELPQLVNVIAGSMSLVGPRPPLPSEVERYTPQQRQRLQIKPGLTCIWQVSGRSTVGFDRWVKMDLQYIEQESLWMDVRILLRTIPAVLVGRGAV